MNFKKFVIGLIVFASVICYPVLSLSKSNKNNKIILDKNNTIVLNTEISDQSVSDTIQKLLKLDSSYWNRNKPIYLFLYSPGGSIQAGLELIEAVHGLHRKVNTITLFSASMAFQLVQNLNKRLILENGVLMSHRAAGEFAGFFGGKKPSQLDSRYALWLERLKELDMKTVARTNGKQTLESYQEQYRDEMWLTGEQAVKEGYADEIVSVNCDNSLKGTEKHNTEFMGYNISYETANCPLITGILNVKVNDPNGKMTPQALTQQIKQKFIDSHDYSNVID